jgi:putative aldouronate transport system substrate-binding protein
MKKRLKTLAVAVALPALLVSACSNSGTNNEAPAATKAPESSTAPTESAAPAEKLEPREISIYFAGPAVQKDVGLVEAEINKITQEKINATVKINHLGWGDYAQKTNLMIASGEPFDLMFTSGNDLSINVAKGAYIALNDPENNLLEKYGQDILSSMNPLFLSGTTIDAKNYAIPTQKEMASTQGMLILKDLVEKYNLDLTTVKKLEDLEPFLEQVKAGEPADVIPIVATSNFLNLLPYEHIGGYASPGVISKTGATPQVVNFFETPEAKQLFELMYDWNKKGYFQKDPGTNTNLKAQTDEGLVAVRWAQLKPGAAEEASVASKKPLVQAEFTEPYVATYDLNNSMLAVSRTSKDPERAVMFLNLMHSDPRIVNLMDYGIEGKHYVKVDGKDNVIKVPDGFATSKDTGYYPGNNWQVGNQFLSYLFENEDPQKWEKFQAFNESGVTSPILGFTYNSEKTKNEEAALASVYKSYIDGLSGGELDPAKFLPEFNDKLKKAGSEKVIAEKQRQIDEFMKNKK